VARRRGMQPHAIARRRLTDRRLTRDYADGPCREPSRRIPTLHQELVATSRAVRGGEDDLVALPTLDDTVESDAGSQIGRSETNEARRASAVAHGGTKSNSFAVVIDLPKAVIHGPLYRKTFRGVAKRAFA